MHEGAGETATAEGERSRKKRASVLARRVSEKGKKPEGEKRGVKRTAGQACSGEERAAEPGGQERKTVEGVKWERKRGARRRDA